MTKTENTTTDARAVLGVFGVRVDQTPRALGYRPAGTSRTNGTAALGSAGFAPVTIGAGVR
jgi:hypothetical protein